MTTTAVRHALDEAAVDGGLPTDELLSRALPLLRAVSDAHDEGLVVDIAGLDGLTITETGDWALNRPPCAPHLEQAAVARVQAAQEGAVQVVDRGTLTQDVGAGRGTYVSHSIVRAGDEVTHPSHLAGYRSWESAVGHHDALSDIAVLGQLLAGLACGLDLFDEAEHAEFVGSRENLFRIAPDLHPVVARAIREMTEPDRRVRAQDLRSLLGRLETYRDQPDDFDLTDLDRTGSGATVRTLVLERLRDRLFDATRRNRLLHFKSTQQTVNLTVASVPQMLDHRRIQAESLLTWQPSTAGALADRQLRLGSYLRFEENPFLAPALDRIISQAKRDRTEYGFAQLRLVVSFLRWHDLRGTAEEVIDSPLLLVPVSLVKRKGVRDTYAMSAEASEAEVNPTLRQRLADLYALQLPERVPLTWEAVAAFHADLAARVQASEPGVSVQTVEQPRIDLIQREARLHAALFARRRVKSAARARRLAPTDHSYHPDDYRPYGSQLFWSTVRPAPLPQRVTAGGEPGPRSPGAMPSAQDVITRGTYELRAGATRGNPYAWEIDLCRLTVGNFNYRRMSLVQDYTRLLASPPVESAFDEAFAQDAKVWETTDSVLPMSEQYLVVDGDSTQLKAVARARTGASYVIQGPPGTGKSQTITNLIADYVARGQRVLFVCEKRAAIDVVFHRLRSSGLDDLCCLIHDSQTDKRAFIADLRGVYERHLADDSPDDHAEVRRAELLADVEGHVSVLHRLTRTLRSELPGARSEAIALLDDLLTLRPGIRVDAVAALSDEQRELLPTLGGWTATAPHAQALGRALTDIGEAPIPSAHPLCTLAPDALLADRPVHHVTDLLGAARRRLAELSDQLEHAGVPEDLLTDLATLISLADPVENALGPLRDAGSLRLLAPSSRDGQAADRLVAEHARRSHAAAEAAGAATGWHTPPEPAVAAVAAAAAQRHGGSFLRVLRPSWRAAQRLVTEGYRGDLGAADALDRLVVAQRASAAASELDTQAGSDYGVPDAALLGRYLALGRTLRGSRAPSVGRAMARPGEPRLDQLVAALQAVAPELRALGEAMTDLFGASAHPRCATSDASALLDLLASELDLLPTLLDPLRALAEADPVARQALLELPLTADEVEFAVGEAAVLDLFAQDRALARLDGPALRRRIGAVAEGRQHLLEANAAVIRGRTRRQLLEHLRLASLPAAQLDANGKAFKKSYAAGRRELEHEFGKVMRYRSIRDLAGGAARTVVADLKPVWLMSPLSVSDTLPLEPDLFDVVIFDEASQIPVEEAVPALHRARQVVVVGDQMQLPPTSFFSATVEDDDVEVEQDGDVVTIPLHGTSFLNQSARNLPSVMLAWHYRSRSEQLIGFSNAAFYAGQLRTVPDRMVHTGELPPITVSGPTETHTGAHEALRRPISFHRLEHGVYSERRNEAEASYIALMVRDLLARGTGLSLGLVAFSEAQQGAIEAALGRLAAQDHDFATRLEAERDREVEDQFVGMFVKNLENVQGDERDIVILSICYAPDTRGRMRMNFGPINAADGEKRLNVIFSRAKHHMVVVSSIDHTAITNDWNDGARALKGFLQFAEASSRGRSELAAAVLATHTPRQRLRPAARREGMVEQIALELGRRGCLVEVDVGASQVRCDLAVRLPGDDAHRLAVLVDHHTVETTDDHERYLDRPRAFSSRGWATAHVLATDWLRDPESVIARLLAEVHGHAEPDAVAAPPADDPDATSTPEPDGDALATEAADAPQPESAPAPERNAGRSSLERAHPGEDPVATGRRFEYVEGTSSKFWTVWTEGSALGVRFGRIGTRGREQLKELDSAEVAATRMERLIAEKVRAGYVEVTPAG